MRRWILTTASLGVIVVWLLLAYMPSLPRPTLGWPAGSGALLALLAGGGLVVFLLIQGWLVRDTDRFLGGNAPAAQVAIQAEFELDKGREVFWTAMPIVMTLGMAALSYGLWRSLFD